MVSSHRHRSYLIEDISIAWLQCDSPARRFKARALSLQPRSRRARSGRGEPDRSRCMAIPSGFDAKRHIPWGCSGLRVSTQLVDVRLTVHERICPSHSPASLEGLPTPPVLPFRNSPGPFLPSNTLLPRSSLPPISPMYVYTEIFRHPLLTGNQCSEHK